MKEPVQTRSVSDFDIHYMLSWSSLLHGDQRLEYTIRLAETTNILFIYLFIYRDQEKMQGCFKKGCESNLSIHFWLVFRVWVPHFETLTAGIPRHGECPTQRYFFLFLKTFFLTCKRALLVQPFPYNLLLQLLACCRFWKFVWGTHPHTGNEYTWNIWLYPPRLL